MNCIVHIKNAWAFLFIQHKCVDIPCLNFQSARIPSLPPRDLALNMANIPWELHQNPRVGHRYVHMPRCLYYTKKSCIFIHARIYTVYYVHIYMLYQDMISVHFSRGFQNMFSLFLWDPQLIVSRNVPRCKPIVDPIRTRKWIHLVQYPTPVAVWILNQKEDTSKQ